MTRPDIMKILLNPEAETFYNNIKSIVDKSKLSDKEIVEMFRWLVITMDDKEFIKT